MRFAAKHSEARKSQRTQAVFSVFRFLTAVFFFCLTPPHSSVILSLEIVRRLRLVCGRRPARFRDAAQLLFRQECLMQWVTAHNLMRSPRADAPQVRPAARATRLPERRRLQMLPDSLSHLHCLHHAALSAAVVRVPVTRSVPPAQSGFCVIGRNSTPPNAVESSSVISGRKGIEAT